MLFGSGGSDERLAAVDAERDAGRERIGEREHDRIGDVLAGTYAAGRVAFGAGGEQFCLLLLAETVVGAGVDGAGGRSR